MFWFPIFNLKFWTYFKVHTMHTPPLLTLIKFILKMNYDIGERAMHNLLAWKKECNSNVGWTTSASLLPTALLGRRLRRIGKMLWFLTIYFQIRYEWNQKFRIKFIYVVIMYRSLHRNYLCENYILYTIHWNFCSFPILKRYFNKYKNLKGFLVLITLIYVVSDLLKTL